MRRLLYCSLLVVLTSCATSRPRPAALPPLVSLLAADSLVGLPNSLPAAQTPQTLLQRLTGGVFGGGAGKTTITQKFKGPTTIIIGNHNAGSAATKPGPTATGPGAVATDAQKATAPVVTGDANQAASARTGPPVAGDRNTVTGPPPSNWWRWLLGGMVVGFALRQVGPWLIRRLFPV
jgi:hypothetical protein